jgi:hypothetical protein
MTKLELLTVLYSLDALHKAGKPDMAHDTILRIISEAENRPHEKKEESL